MVVERDGVGLSRRKMSAGALRIKVDLSLKAWQKTPAFPVPRDGERTTNLQNRRRQ